MNKKILLLSNIVFLLGSCGSTTSESTISSSIPSEEDTPIDIANAVELNVDFSELIDPPLLKKIDMYNAGCIQPLSNYERDFKRIRELNSSALRIDLSIGKEGGTAGQYLVSDDYDYSDYDETTGQYNVVKDSLKYDFTQLDSVVDYLEDNGVLPYMSWDYIPYPLQENGKWNDLDQNIRNWKEIWEETLYQYAKHYKDNNVKIGYHEIYNEPDLEILKCWGVFDDSFDGFLDWNDFCLGSSCQPGKGVYPDMYEYGAKGILRADPDASIGGPAFALGEIGVEDWVGFLPRVIEKNLPLDFYSFHSYLDGETWFLPEEKRANGDKNELEKVVEGLAKNEKFLNTAIHINEYSYLNESNGSTNGLNSDYNFYEGASKTLSGMAEVINRTSVQWAYWAQFMESTGGYDPYGMIEHVGGNIKAPFNAMKMYNDMPVWRYEAKFNRDNTGLETMVSSSEDKIGVLIWNTNDSKDSQGNAITENDKTVRLKFENSKFEESVRRLYRIDKDHGSYFDNNANAELEIVTQKEVNSNDDSMWVGNIPAGGVVYLTFNKEGASDFTAYDNRQIFANDVKTSYYYEDRYRGLIGSREIYEDYVNGYTGSYSHYDRTNSTMYLGMGDCLGNGEKFEGQAVANGAIVFRDLPEHFKVALKSEGDIKMRNSNTTLGMRIDFFDETENDYVSSVYFHNGLYSSRRNPNAQDSKLSTLPFYPWGTKEKPDEVIAIDGDIFDVDLTKIAPEGWDSSTGKAQISFEMRNTGAKTRATFQFIK